MHSMNGAEEKGTQVRVTMLDIDSDDFISTHHSSM